MVLKVYQDLIRNLAPQRVQVKTCGVHSERETLNKFFAATCHSVDNDRIKLRAKSVAKFY